MILLRYLLEAKAIPLRGGWVTEKDLPGGVTFFQGPRCLTRDPVHYILWQETDEFPPHRTVVFDASVGDHLPLDMIWAAVHAVSIRLAWA